MRPTNDTICVLLLSYPHQRWPSTNMELPDWFSGLKKKLKHPPGSKRKPDGTGADAGWEGPDRAGLLPRPEPHIVMRGGHDEGNGANASGRPVPSTAGSGPGRGGNEGKVERVYPSPPTPSTPHSGKPDSM